MIRTHLHLDAITLAARPGATLDQVVRTLRVLGYSPLEALGAGLDCLLYGVIAR